MALEFKFEFELPPPHESQSQLTPTAPTQPAAVEPPPARTAPTKELAKSRASSRECVQRRKRIENQRPLATTGGASAARPMSRDKPAPPVVSTGCSGLLSCSCLSRHRRVPQQQPAAAAPRRRSDVDGGGAGDAAAFEIAERCWKRMQLLEEEVRRLSGGHEVRPAAAPGATERVVRARAAEGGGVATDRVGNGAKATAEGGSSVSSGTGTATTAAAATRRAGVGHGVHEVVRLEDGSYMREVMLVGRPWERLAVQVSRPAVPADAVSASEVLGKMAAMRAVDLCKFLVQLMPLKDITGQKNPGEPVCRTARLISGDDLVEALVLDALGKMEYLVLEGLKIQMASPATEPATAAAAGDGRRDKSVVSKDCMVHVVLMQARDPKERYRAIGQHMIGLIEASLEMKDATVVRQRILGLHVAGISFVTMRRPSDGRCVLWSAYLRRCNQSYGGDGDGDGGGDGCRCICVRNPNRVLPSRVIANKDAS